MMLGVSGWSKVTQGIVAKSSFSYLGNWQELSSFQQMCSSIIIHAPRERSWVVEVIFPDFQALEVIMLEKSLLKDLGKLTEFCHTSQIEIFKFLIKKYSPNVNTFSQ